MHRSHSSTRVSDELYRNSSSSTAGASPAAAVVDADGHLPVYSPASDVAKREKSRLRSAENAIHLIPLTLVLCAIILWFFSNPIVDLANKKPDLVVSRDQGLKAAGSIEIGGAHNSLPAHLKHPELKDVDLLHHHHHLKPSV